jgi:hypothetical protein
VVSILSLEGKQRCLFSYRLICPLDTVGKQDWVLKGVNEPGLLRDEQFGFKPRRSTMMQLARLAEGQQKL